MDKDGFAPVGAAATQTGRGQAIGICLERASAMADKWNMTDEQLIEILRGLGNATRSCNADSAA